MSEGYRYLRREAVHTFLVPAGAPSREPGAGAALAVLTQEAAEAELREILEDEPEWVNVLRVVPIEFDERNVSLN